MTDQSSEYVLDNLTSEEAADALETADYVALPCGATEQHSRHLPLSVDTIRAEELTRELAERAPAHDLEILVLPPLAYGYSENHMHFPGTVTLQPETYRDLVVDIGTSMAEHDANRLLLVNSHLGNQNLLELAADDLQRNHDLPTHYLRWVGYATDLLEERWGDEWGHAGPHETSMVEHYRPELVRTERVEPPTTRPRPKTRKFRHFDELTEEGATADPTDSDPDYIETVIEETTDRILSALKDDVDRGRWFDT